MENQQSDNLINVERVLRVVRSHWIEIALCVLLGAGAGFGLSQLQTKKYKATTAILFTDAQISQLEAGLTAGSSATPTQQTATDFALLTSQGQVADRVAKAVGHGLTAGAVSAAISVAPQGTSSIANITATAASPVLAAEIANAFAQQFIAVRSGSDAATAQSLIRVLRQQLKAMSPLQQTSPQGLALSNRISSLQTSQSLQGGEAQIIRQATPPGSPASPQPRRSALLGAVLGLLVAGLLLFVRERFDRRLQTVEEVQAELEVPLLGVIPHIAEVEAPPGHTASDPSGALESPRATTMPDGVESSSSAAIDAPPISAMAMESFRILRAHLRYFNIDRKLHTVLVSSESPGEGKTVVSCYLAQVAATMGTKTLLIDADLRRGGVARRLRLSPENGLADVLVGNVSLEDAICHIPVESRMNGFRSGTRLDVLVAGPHPPNAAELLESSAMVSLLQDVAEQYEFVLLDSTPLSVVSDAVPLLQRVDGVILVTRLGYTTRDALRHLLETVRNLRAPVFGAVANDQARPPSYGYGYGAGYYSPAEANGSSSETAGSIGTAEALPSPETEFADADPAP